MRAAWLLPFLLLAPAAMGQSPNGGFDDFDGFAGCGGVSFDDVEARTLSYSSCSFSGGENGGSIDVMEMHVSVEGTGRMNMEGFSARGSQSGGNALAFALQLDLLQVVEFVDEGDGKYVPGDDEVIALHSLNGGWGTLRTSNADRGIQFEVDHPIGSGTFTLAAKATGSSYNAGGVNVKPLDTKIDFILRDYDYGHPESQLALVLHVASEGFSAEGSGFGTDSGVVQSREQGVVGTQGPTSLYFTWAKTADVDGEAQAVVSHVDIRHSDGQTAQGNGGSATVSETEAGITLAYARGDEIMHDPRLGVQFSASKESPGLPLIGLLVALAALAALRRR